MILTSLELDPKEFERRTGWVLKAEGACKGDTCVPLPDDAGSAGLDARMISQRLGMPLVDDGDTGVWCLGPEALGRALTDLGVQAEIGDGVEAALEVLAREAAPVA